MGGEESGGLSLREHVHERDGVLNGLFLLEMMATGFQGKNLGECFHLWREMLGEKKITIWLAICVVSEGACRPCHPDRGREVMVV